MMLNVWRLCVCVCCEKIWGVFTNHVAPRVYGHVNEEVVAELRLHYFPKHTCGSTHTHTRPNAKYKI